LSWSLAFTIANAAVMPAWLLLILAPHARITQLLVHALWIPLGLGIAYAIFIFSDLGAGGGFDMAGVQRALQNPSTFLGAWIHYLIFDLFIAAWQVRDAKRRSIPHWMVVPCLIMTLLFGPTGLLLYSILRIARGQGFYTDESPRSAR
jgi:hypothetical protein